ncbi:MAG: bifunctional folylpolyglutamate synthase/dihydrofolate synthase [Chitinophagia bacterium]|jgi:dihydrofolate synthase/folylpolyglutamate synthase|nr:bifunctional folylpolyglutamate synthase/dihydrofolate synthase [Chitinophagia bacterium]NDD15913.1 bifunctional folylpolyglutamate synthase/dihydrofolate synthase [Chitinophagia bacterium]
MFSRIGAAAIKNDLNNTQVICSFLGNPEKKFKTIHIAGTNGKGSTSHMLAAIFQKAGYKTGLYTSPHLYDFRERIKVNGEMCRKEFVISFSNKVKPLIEKIEPSFFEITVGMAFEYFAVENCDIAIIETGLGGRLDSTNVIEPILSLITNIGWDHMALLGNSLEAIASEKAGIIKKETPVVISESIPESKSVFIQKAALEDAPIYFSEDFIQAEAFENNWHNASFSFSQPLIHLLSKPLFDTKFTLSCDLPGKYQAKNLKGVLVACQLLAGMGWKLTSEIIMQALLEIKASTGLMGRWECIQSNPRIILDVAHNEHGIKAMLDQLTTTQYEQLYIVTGMVKDKDVNAVLNLLPKNANYYFTQSHLPRALAAQELAEKANLIGLKGDIYNDVNIALEIASAKASDKDLILVIGSVYLVAEVNRALFKK